MPHPREVRKQNPAEDVFETDFRTPISRFTMESKLADITTCMVQPEAKEDSGMEVAPLEGEFDLMQLPERALTDGSTYNGQWFRGLPHGDGLRFWPNGKRYQGEFHDGKADGTGSCSLADGSKYVGPWVNDNPHGSMGFSLLASGEFYLGEFVNGKEHGEGHLTLPDRSTFIGQFQGGLKTGRGRAVYRTYSETESCDVTPAIQKPVVLGIYDGEFANDRFHGEGTYRWRDGRSFEGQWHMNKMHGHGKYTFVDGRSYEGQYKHGQKSGFGRYSWPDGRTYVGQVLHGARHGQGTYSTPQGKRLEGVWHHGVLSAQAKTSTASCSSPTIADLECKDRPQLETRRQVPQLARLYLW